MVGCRAVFATHFHELAANADKINAELSEMNSKLVSMAAGVEREGEQGQKKSAVKRTYKVVPSPPQGLSYAQDIARRYGISFEQIQSKLRRQK